MIIVFVHQTFWPVLGGCEIAMLKIAEELAKRNHEVHILSSTLYAKERPRHEKIGRVNIHRVRGFSIFYSDLTIPYDLPSGLLREADIVHGWSQNSLFTYIVCRRAKKYKKPIIIYFMGVDYLQRHFNPLIRIFGFSYQKNITRKVVELTDLALVTNEYERFLLKTRYSMDAVVLPHGVDEKYFVLPNMAKEFREKYGIRERVIAYIGRLHPTKGVDQLIRSLKYVVSQLPDVVLVMAGRGEPRYEHKLRKLIESLNLSTKVLFLGYISEYDKIALIDSSDIVVLPTRHAGENYSLIIDEVSARGKDVLLIGASTALVYRIKKERKGLIIDPGNSQLLAHALIQCIENRPFINSVRSDYIKVFSWRNIAIKLLDLYSSLVNR